MFQIPFNGFAHAVNKIYFGDPAQFGADLCGVNGIPAIMAGTVFDISDQRSSSLAVREPADFFIQNIADGVNDFNVLLVTVSADIVSFSDFSALDNGENRFTVIDNIKLVADIFAVAIHRQRASVKSIVDDQGNELFRKLRGSIIIGTVGKQRRQTIGMKIGADQMVG